MFRKVPFFAAIACLNLGLGWPAARAEGPAVRLEDTEDLVETVELELGEQRVISAEGVRSYSEGTRGVVDVKLTRDGKQFVLVAASAGTTSLLFLLMNGKDRQMRVTVRDPNQPLVPQNGAPSVERAENIRLDFYFVELSRSYGHQVGIRYPSTIQGGTFSAGYDFLTQSFSGATAVVENQALLRLDVAQSRGFLKVRRQAAVITENGRPAKLTGGGEVNVAVTGGISSTLQSITYGSEIQVLPRFDARSGRIEVELEADVSDLSDDRGTGVPGRTRSTLKTAVNLTLGQVIVLGGLSSETEVRNQSGLPFLSQIPILGALFRTHRNERSETESLIFIVPSVIDSPSDEVRRQLGQALESYTKFHGERIHLETLRAEGGPK
jgi:pilus assembly protein CpaC